jgi:hypothetical protein
MCDIDITKVNETEEHIILNALGGRLKSKELICHECNIGFGTLFDDELARQMEVFTNLLNIKRDRGTPNSIVIENSKTGEKVIIRPGGKPEMFKPEINITSNNSKATISFAARNMKEARKILAGQKRKYPQIEIEEALNTSRKSSGYLKSSYEIRMKIGGTNSLRSVCKTAMHYYILTGGDRQYIEHLIPFVKQQKEVNCVGFYYTENEIIFNRPRGIYHTILLIGDSCDNSLIAYIELFSGIKYIVLLNENYKGVGVEKLYCFDVINQKQITYDYRRITKKDAEAALKIGDLPVFAVQKSINDLLEIIFKKQTSEHISELTNRAVLNSLGKYPEDTEITQDMVDELINECTKQITPFLIHRLNGSSK